MEKKILLKNKNYCLFWISSAANMAASNILQFVLSLYVLSITGSATMFAAMLSIIVIPEIILTPIAGVIADRFKKIRMMTIITFAEMIILFIFFILSSSINLNVAMIYVLVTLLEIGEVFYSGPSEAIIPEIVHKDCIKDAISVSKVDDGIVCVASPVIAACIYATLSIDHALLIVALLYMVTAVLQCMIHPEYETEQKNSSMKISFVRDIKEGLESIKSDDFLKRFVKISPVFNALFGATFAVSITYLLREIYVIDSYQYGMYNAVTSSMSIIAPFFAMPLIKKVAAEKIFSISTILISIEILLIAVMAYMGVEKTISVPLSVIAITIFDCMTILAAIPMQMSMSVIYQTKVDKAVLGRVSSINRMLIMSSIAIAELIFGIINDHRKVYVTIFIAGIGLLISAIAYRISVNKRDVYVEADHEQA